MLGKQTQKVHDCGYLDDVATSQVANMLLVPEDSYTWNAIPCVADDNCFLNTLDHFSVDAILPTCV